MKKVIDLRGMGKMYVPEKKPYHKSWIAVVDTVMFFAVLALIFVFMVALNK